MMTDIDIFTLNNNLSTNQINYMVSEIKKDKLALIPKTKAPIYKKSIWYDHHNRYFLFKLHSLSMIKHLLIDYHLNKDDQSILKSIEYFYLWYEENFQNSQCDLCYHPYVLAERLMVVSNLLSMCQSLDLCILDDLFINVISSHTRMLTLDHIYKKEHLDSLYQDISLIYSSFVYNNYYIDNAYNTYIDLGMKRLKEALDYFIDDLESSFLGESIQNAYRMFIQLEEFRQFLNEYTNFTSFSQFVKAKQDHLYSYIYNFTLPDGTLPPIGDSSNVTIDQKIILNYPHPFNKKFTNLLKKREKELNSHIFYPKANCFILNDSIQLVFINAFFSTHHKHHDNLSFSLFYKGHFIFTDGGRYNYQRENYYRQAINGIYSHNTICVDFHDYQISKQKINQCGIVNVVNDESASFACAIHVLYEDVILKRSLVKHNNHLLILDEAYSKETHDYEIIFNVNQNIKLKTRGNKEFYGFVGDESIFSLKPIYSTISLTPSYNYDNKNHYKGIISPKLNQVEPAHNLIYHGKGQNELIVSHINLGDEDENIEVYASDEMIQINFQKASYKILKGKYYNVFHKHHHSLNQNISTNNTLNRAIKTFFSLK